MPEDEPTIGTTTIDQPCPFNQCETTLYGTVTLKARRAVTRDEHGQVVLNIRPQFPVDWSPETLAHVETHHA
jgi:hypothetical protein